MSRNRIEAGFNPSQPIIVDAGPTIIPCAGSQEIYRVGLTPFQDHGRPAFFGSTIRSNPTLVKIARGLSAEDTRRLNAAMGMQLERLLDKEQIDSQAVLTSNIKGKPPVHVVFIGNPFNESGLRLYCHPGEHKGATVLWVDGKGTKKDARKIETAYRPGGYTAPENWDNRKGRS